MKAELLELMVLDLVMTLRDDEVNTIFQVPAILPKFIQCYLSEENIALCWWHSVKLLPIWLA